jgi:hypothetical protein
VNSTPAIGRKVAYAIVMMKFQKPNMHALAIGIASLIVLSCPFQPL